MAQGNINLWRVGGVQEGSATLPPPRAGGCWWRALRLHDKIRLRGGPGRARCGCWGPLAPPRQRSRRYNPRNRPHGPCSLRLLRCSRTASTKLSPGAQSGNGASPKSCRGGTRLNGKSPPTRRRYDAWPW